MMGDIVVFVGGVKTVWNFRFSFVCGMERLCKVSSLKYFTYLSGAL